MAAITLRRLSKSFGKTRVIHDVDLEIRDREFVVFVGPSGCGKSTLLRLVAGLEDISSGKLEFDGQVVNDLPPAQRQVAMVFQSYALYPHMSVYENMAFGLKLARRDKSAIDERVREVARILQIESLLDRKPKELSGGQRQRVAIGRAIVRQPRAFLFDEPLSNLDAALRVQMRIEIARLHRELDATMIYVTHDQIEAMTLADRIVVLNGGRVEQFGTPLELYERPRNRFVAGFIGSPKMNFVDATVTAIRDDGVELDLAGGANARLSLGAVDALSSGQRVCVGVRPEHFVAEPSAGMRFEGRVATVERLGSESYVYLDCGSAEPLVVKTDADPGVQAGESYTAVVPAGACYLFDEQGKAIVR